jgi:hypothetical protein
MVFESRRDEVFKHLELAEKFLTEGKDLILKDPIQASEKLYKAAEEVVKALTKYLNLPQVKEVEKVGRWTTELLFKAVLKLSEEVDGRIRSWWHTAWVLHVEGFHEGRLGSDIVLVDYGDIEALVNLTKKVIQGVRQ